MRQIGAHLFGQVPQLKRSNFISFGIYCPTLPLYLSIIANSIYYLLIELEVRPRNRFDVLPNTARSIGHDQKKDKPDGITMTSKEMNDASDQRAASVDAGRKMAGEITL